MSRFNSSLFLRKLRNPRRLQWPRPRNPNRFGWGTTLPTNYFFLDDLVYSESGILGWHFLRKNMRLSHDDGRMVVPGETLKVARDRNFGICRRGLHASADIIDAINFSPGPVLCRVLLSGYIILADNKMCATRRTCLWMLNLEDLSSESFEELAKRTGTEIKTEHLGLDRWYGRERLLHDIIIESSPPFASKGLRTTQGQQPDRLNWVRNELHQFFYHNAKLYGRFAPEERSVSP